MSANAHHCWAIITRDKNKAETLMESIKEEQKLEGNLCKWKLYREYEIKLGFENGVCLIAFPPIENFKGFRFHRLWCDKDINQDYLEQVILPMAVYMKYEDIIWI